MEKICDYRLCTGCGVCSVKCPKHCIEMIQNEEGFSYPHIDISKCINCGICIKSCHILSEMASHKGHYYKAWHTDKEVLKKSSSGGVFTALASYVLEHDGVVVGAEINQKTRDLKHVVIQTVDDLDKIRLSKYYQSSTIEVYEEINSNLNNKRLVLFCGTACQIAALKCYLKEPNDYLITVDILCHGVTSKKTVDAYVKSKEKQYKKKITSIFFRVKTGKTGWMQGWGTRMKLVFNDGSSAIMNKETDTFFTAFNNNLILRESCYSCKYCGDERISDFTLADHWGIEKQEVSDEQKWYGVSLVLVNTTRATQILNEIKDDIQISSTNPVSARNSNKALREPNIRPGSRSVMFSLIDKVGFDKAVHKILKNYYRKAKIRAVIYRIIGENNYIKIMSILKRRGR